MNRDTLKGCQHFTWSWKILVLKFRNHGKEDHKMLVLAEHNILFITEQQKDYNYYSKNKYY